MKLRVLFYTLLALVVAHPALAQRGDKAYPVDAATMQKYPELTKEQLTPIKAAQLDLKGEFLEDTMTVFDLIHSVDRYAYEVLQKGTFVYVDKNRNVRYKGDCANRIEKANNCPKCLEIIAALRADSITKATALASLFESNKAKAAEEKSWFSKAADWLLDALKFLFYLVLVVAVLIAFVGLVDWLWTELKKSFGGGTPAKTAPVPAPLAPAPVPLDPSVPSTRRVVVPPVAPAPEPAPTPEPESEILTFTPRQLEALFPDGVRIRLDRSK